MSRCRRERSAPARRPLRALALVSCLALAPSAAAGQAEPRAAAEAATSQPATVQAPTPQPAVPQPAVPRPAAHVFLDYARDAAAHTCLAPGQLVEAVETRLGRRVFVPAPEADLTAEVRARRRAGRFVIDVALFDRDRVPLGQRQLTTAARHCSALDDSLALVLSLAADVPSPGVQPRGPEAPAPVSPAPAPTSLGTPLAIPATTHAPRLGLRLEPSLGVALLAGPLPGVALGVEVGVTLQAGHFWPVSLKGSGWWPEQHRVEGGRGARFSATSLELGVCPWQGQLGALSVRGCVLNWLARVRAHGIGFDDDDRSERWVVALGGGVNVGQQWGPVFISAGAELLAPLVRRRYFFTDGSEDTTLHDEPWVFGLAGARLGTEF